MTDDEVFAASFSGHEARIRTLRVRESVFDEICRDYLQMYRQLADASEAADAVYRSVVLESLHGLHEEITDFLERETVNHHNER